MQLDIRYRDRDLQRRHKPCNTQPCEGFANLRIRAVEIYTPIDTRRLPDVRKDVDIIDDL